MLDVSPNDAMKKRKALRNLLVLIRQPEGREFFKYLFEEFAIGDLPPVGVPESVLYHDIGFLKAGQTIFELVAQADAHLASLILAELKKEQYDAITKNNDVAGQS